MIHRRRFADSLRNARENAGISQEQLAERAGLHRTYISQLERGLKSPSLDVIVVGLHQQRTKYCGHFLLQRFDNQTLGENYSASGRRWADNQRFHHDARRCGRHVSGLAGRSGRRPLHQFSKRTQLWPTNKPRCSYAV